MTCTGGRLARFFEVESLFSVPRDVQRSSTSMSADVAVPLPDWREPQLSGLATRLGHPGVFAKGFSLRFRRQRLPTVTKRLLGPFRFGKRLLVQRAF